MLKIYRDVIEGVVFQYIQCKDPSNILAVHFRDETLLAFMEGKKEVQIFIYRGIEGFIPFRNIQLNAYAQHMSALTLPPKINYKCDHYYLVLQIDNELRFIEMQIAGNCGNSVKCGFY
jgi:female sterile (1) Nasrat